jgi:hypothetical protein
MRMCPHGFVDGIDYSTESVRFSRAKNAAELASDARSGRGTRARFRMGMGCLIW